MNINLLKSRVFKGYLNTLFNEWEIGNQRTRQNLRILVASIALGSIFTSITTGSALTGYIYHIGAGDFIFGLVAALPFLGAAFQFHSVLLLRSRKACQTITIIAGLIQRGLWLVFALLSIFVPGFGRENPIWSFVALVTLAAVAGNYLVVSFTMMLSNIVPSHICGSYLSLRNRFAILSASIIGILVAFILDFFSGGQGYAIAFLLAGLFGVIDILTLFFVRYPDQEAERLQNKMPIRQLLTEPLKSKPFRRMTLFWILWNFSYMLCSPFFAYYILGEMQINFMTYTLGCLITSSLTSLIILPFWGKMIDRVGCKPVIKIAFAATGALGFIWILAKRGNPWIPVVFFIIGGFFWCVNDLASQHMLISQTPAKNKAAYIATFSVLTAVLGNAPATLVSGALLGLFEKATVFFRNSNGQPLLDRYQILFIFASIIRILFIGIFADKILDQSSSCPISSRRKK